MLVDSPVHPSGPLPRATPRPYHLAGGKLHRHQTSLSDYFTSSGQRQPSIASLPRSVTSSNQRREEKKRRDTSASASSVGGRPGGVSRSKNATFGKDLFKDLKDNFPLVELLYSAMRDSRKGDSFDMTLLEEKLLRLSAQGRVYKSSDFSNLSVATVLEEFGLSRVRQDRFKIPTWSPLDLLDQCPSQFKALTPDEIFWANVGRYERHLAPPVSGNEALARIRVDLVILTVLDVLHQQIPDFPALRISYEVFLKHLHHKTKAVWSGRVDYSVGLPTTGSTEWYNYLSICEAKRDGLVGTAIGQLTGYMAVTRAARLELKREDLAVFGASTDGQQWQFFAIDRNGQWIKSALMSMYDSRETINTVFRNLAVIIYLSWKQHLRYAPSTADPAATVPLVPVMDYGTY